MQKSLVGQEIRILWDDAWQSESYYTLEEIGREKPKSMNSTGICIRDDKVALVLAMDDLRPDNDDRYRDIKFIPRGMVRQVKVLK